MKAVIMAAGKGSRWNNYLGIPKCLVIVDGEPILYRTIRLLKERGVKDIYVTVPSKGFYGELKAEEIIGDGSKEISRFLNAKEHAGATFFYGDTYYTEDTIDIICKNRKRPMFFGRNKYTGWGKKHLELFAIATNKKTMEVAEWLSDKELFWGTGWYVYLKQVYNIFPENQKEKADVIKKLLPDFKRFTPIDDETEDFDDPEEYTLWIKNYNLYQQGGVMLDEGHDIIYPIDSRIYTGILPLSLRTTVNIPHRDIYTVGGFGGIKGTIHIPFKDEGIEPLANIIEKLKLVISDDRISEDFILMNDDFLILREYPTIPYYHRGKIEDFTSNSYWKDRLPILLKRFPKGNIFNIHFPIMLNKTKLNKLLQKENVNDIIKSDLRTWYCNYYKIKGEYSEDYKTHTSLDLERAVHYPFVSTTNEVEKTKMPRIERILKKHSIE